MNTDMRGVYRSMWWAFGGQTIPNSLATRTRTNRKRMTAPDARVEYPDKWPMQLPSKLNVRL